MHGGYLEMTVVAVSLHRHITQREVRIVYFVTNGALIISAYLENSAK